jgi:hypothetical protein
MACRTIRRRTRAPSRQSPANPGNPSGASPSPFAVRSRSPVITAGSSAVPGTLTPQARTKQLRNLPSPPSLPEPITNPTHRTLPAHPHPNGQPTADGDKSPKFRFAPEPPRPNTWGPGNSRDATGRMTSPSNGAKKSSEKPIDTGAPNPYFRRSKLDRSA